MNIHNNNNSPYPGDPVSEKNIHLLTRVFVGTLFSIFN